MSDLDAPTTTEITEMVEWSAEKLNERREILDAKVAKIRRAYQNAADREAADLLKEIAQIDWAFRYRSYRSLP
jgi:hypothetical protein